MTADAGLTRSTPAHWARWARENAVAYGSLERATERAIELAVAEALAIREQT